MSTLSPSYQERKLSELLNDMDQAYASDGSYTEVLAELFRRLFAEIAEMKDLVRGAQ